MALKAVGAEIYGWQNEPDIREMEHDKNYAVNLPLQQTPPHLLPYLDKDYRIDLEGAVVDGVIERELLFSYLNGLRPPRPIEGTCMPAWISSARGSGQIAIAPKTPTLLESRRKRSL